VIVTNQERLVLEQLRGGHRGTQQFAGAVGRTFGSVHASLISLEKKGLVRGEPGEACLEWTLTEEGMEQLGGEHGS